MEYLTTEPNFLEIIANQYEFKEYPSSEPKSLKYEFQEIFTPEPNFLEIIGKEYEFKNNVNNFYEHYFSDPTFAKVKETPLCVICLGNCSTRKTCKLSRVSCGHHFHTKCISKWLEINFTCPVC